MAGGRQGASDQERARGAEETVEARHYFKERRRRSADGAQRGVKDDSRERCLVSSWIYGAGVQGTSPGWRYKFERHQLIGGS